MCQTSISVILMCKLCRGSFRQVDDFIEHKKEEHFTQFQNTSCIIFEETENDELCPVIIKAETQPTDSNVEPPIKIELNDEDPLIPFSSEIIDEPNLDFLEPKSELFTFESEINPQSENNFFGLEQPEQNPYVHLKRLTFEEIQRTCMPQNHSRLLNFEQKIFANDLDLEPLNLPDVDSTMIDRTEGEKSTEIQPTTTVRNNSSEYEVQLECNLCSKQLQSDGQLKIHVGICALYHKNRNRYCVLCNKIFWDRTGLKRHCKRYHGTEEEKASLYKFKCHSCPKQFQGKRDLLYHLGSHQQGKQQIKISPSPSLPFQCSQPNCGKVFNNKSNLCRHTATHFRLRRSNCNKKFTQSGTLKIHLRTHNGERPFKCTVDSCNKTFMCSSNRSRHHRIAHRS